MKLPLFILTELKLNSLMSLSWSKYMTKHNPKFQMPNKFSKTLDILTLITHLHSIRIKIPITFFPLQEFPLEKPFKQELILIPDLLMS
jgi:hypothetical protein